MQVMIALNVLMVSFEVLRSTEEKPYIPWHPSILFLKQSKPGLLLALWLSRAQQSRDSLGS